jgi:hypothetical protein
MLRRLRLCVSVLALFAAAGGAHAGTIFEQSFGGGLGASETLSGNFAVKNGTLGHHDNYLPLEHSWYQVSLDLTGYTAATLAFDWTMSTERYWDGWNLKASTGSGFALLNGSGVSYADVIGVIGAAATGFGSGKAQFDLTPFAGKVVDLRWSFYGDNGNQWGGVTFDNIAVVGTAAVVQDPGPLPGVPEPATWAMMIGGFGAVGAALRRRRSGEALA